ncbi:MAG: RraA family protein [Candidatus Bathyarchaeota archaeon]|nr:RraA family protein [Candidatus Bathyarchaeota archaeon]
MNLDSLSERLYTAVLSDVLDSMGLQSQSPDVELHPMTGCSSLLGYAKTLQWEDYVDAHGDPYEMLIEAVDSVEPGEVVVSAVSGYNRSALWGELLSTATRMRGGRGAIVDGAVRDVDQMREMGFPCFARSKTPRDSAHRQNIVAIDEPVVLGGVRIEPGDMVMIDADGMVVIPSERAEEVIGLALEKIEKEDTTRQELLRGRLLGDVYEEYGVL